MSNERIEYSNERMKPLHATILEILDHLLEICRENDLKVMIIGGTTLGAYRHGGFIPWDDDLDVALPRKDYDKLLELVHNGDESRFFIMDESCETRYFLPFAKLCKQGTVFREAIAPEVYSKPGIYVDLFPIDTVDEASSMRFKLRATVIKLISHALRVRECQAYYKAERTKLHYSFDMITSIPFWLFSNKQLLRYQRKLMVSRNDRPAKYAISYGSTYRWQKELLPIEVMYPLGEISFEGRMCPCYADLDAYLTQLYGDYMTLPPEEARHTHEPVELKF